MLGKIVLIFTKPYKEKIQGSSAYRDFAGMVRQHGAESELYEIEETECVLMAQKDNAMAVLVLSDEQNTLQRLREEGYFTIACYHEQVRGTLSGTQYAIEGIEDMDWDYFVKVYQRYREEPWNITQTGRCIIREMAPEDADALYELYADERITRYTEALFQDKEQENQYIKDYIENIYKYFGFGTWLICKKEDGRLIGRVGFNYRPGFEEVELGFVTGVPFQRMGYAYEVCSHLLEMGREVFGFNKIQALADKENTASLRLLDKLGFIYVENVIVDGRECRRYLYG